MMRTWGLAVGVVLLLNVSPTFADKKKPDKSKILAEIAKLQNEVSVLVAKKNSELQNYANMMDQKIQKARNEAKTEDNKLNQLQAQKRAALDQIYASYAQDRLKFVNIDNQLKVQIAQAIQQRDAALIGKTGDAANTIRAQFEVQISQIRAKINENNKAWQLRWDKRQTDLAKANAHFDQLIGQEKLKDNKENNDVGKVQAEKQKHLAHLVAKWDKQIAPKNAKIAQLQKQL